MKKLDIDNLDAETQLIWNKCSKCGIGLHKDEIFKSKIDEKDICETCWEYELNEDSKIGI
jgi:acetyl-CoA carboxylase beta subunit